MRVVITGGHGFVGSALARELVSRGSLRGQPVDELLLADKVTPETSAFDGVEKVRTVPGDLLASLPQIFAQPVDVVFHLASAVSSECERDFDLGMASNLASTMALLEAARSQAATVGPLVTVVFSNSVAVYGGDPALPLPETVSEAVLPTPRSSYGAQKFASETLIAD